MDRCSGGPDLLSDLRSSLCCLPLPSWGDLRAAAILGEAVGKGKPYSGSMENIQRQNQQASFTRLGVPKAQVDYGQTRWRPQASCSPGLSQHLPQQALSLPAPDHSRTDSSPEEILRQAECKQQQGEGVGHVEGAHLGSHWRGWVRRESCWKGN